MTNLNKFSLFGRVKKIHFIGIGGIGMSGIAEILIGMGLDVRGSDLKESENTARLSALGARINIGHNAQLIEDVDVVVVSTAVSKINVELVAAQKLKLPILPRAKMLAELMRLKHGVAVAGSHGKTTTTSLIAAILSYANYDPTIIIGGIVHQLGSNARLGLGDLLVAEADESDGSFAHLTPSLSVLTNIDYEHMNHWTGGIEELKDELVNFANRLPFYGLMVLCSECDHVKTILPRILSRKLIYGTSETDDYQALDITQNHLSTSFNLKRFGVDCGRVQLNLVGTHNALNALAAIAICDELQVPLAKIREALAEFGGVQRRFQLLGEFNRIAVVDDYGHHPTEIKAVLGAARKAFSDRRLLVLFQPHKYSRTQDLMKEFAAAFGDAAIAIFTDIYSAGEEAIPGISSEILTTQVGLNGCSSIYGGDLASATNRVCELAQEGDVIITLGAGSITKSARVIADRLQQCALASASVNAQLSTRS